jgi:hypothetical protein
MGILLLLIANTIFEIAVGCVMLFFPTLLLSGNELSISLSRVLGCNAFALSTLSLLMLKFRDDAQKLRLGLITFSIFHTLVAIAQFINFLDGTTGLPVVIIHSLFAVLFISFLWKQIK